jgi:hypothetical protein
MYHAMPMVYIRICTVSTTALLECVLRYQMLCCSNMSKLVAPILLFIYSYAAMSCFCVSNGNAWIAVSNTIYVLPRCV